MTYSLEPMTIDDYDQVYALWKATSGLALNEADSREAIAVFLDRNPDLSLVVREEGKVVAAVLCGHDGRRGYLHHLAVGDGHQRRGLGTQLVDRCLENLARRGILTCNALVQAGNAVGQRFWNKQGWHNRVDVHLMQTDTCPADG